MVNTKIVAGVVSIFVVIVLIGSILVPVIEQSEQKTVFTQTNTSATGIRMMQQTSDFSLDMSVSFDDESNITIQNGTDSQTAEYGSMFLMAADNSAIYAGDDGPIAIWTSGGNNYAQVIDDDFTVQLGESNIEIVKGGDTYTLPLPTSYLFVPSSTGYYTSFTDGGLDKLSADPVVAISEVFAGVVAYNDFSFGGTVIEQITGTSTFTDNVKWGAASEPEPEIQNFDPNQIQFDPVIIDPLDPGNQIMSVPTPTYTDGDWGYEIENGDAIIVSYSGAGGGIITVPATVGGYDVVAVGKGVNYEVISSDLSGTGLVLSEGIETITTHAFRNLSNFTGTIVLPSTLTSIGNAAFYQSGFDKMIVYGSPTIASSGYTLNMSGMKEILNLGETSIEGGNYGLPADVTVKNELDSVCYVGHLTQIEITNNPYNQILSVIPMMVIIAVLLGVVGMMLLRRE